MDPSNATKIITLTDGETVTVTEEVPPGWMLDVDDEECTGDTGEVSIKNVPNGLSFNCEDENKTVTCTFFNQGPPIVPTLSEWGLIAMAGILGIVGFMILRRKKVTG